MIYHILNGDALIGRFLATGLSGEMIIARECLIEGNADGDTLDEFWINRAEFIAGEYEKDQESYFNNVASEFKKLLLAPDGSEFNLWFGYDLFCRVNMWFVIHLLRSLPIQKTVFIIYPSFLEADDIWQDFGTSDPEDLITAFENRICCSESDLRFGDDLWRSYKDQDLEQLRILSETEPESLPYLKEVCRAHIDRFPLSGRGRPEQVIQDIIADAYPDFHAVFKEFSIREGVYGFGDLQVKRIYDRLI